MLPCVLVGSARASHPHADPGGLPPLRDHHGLGFGYRAAAVALARAGCDVGITWHEDREGAERTADEVRASGRRAEIRRLDLTRLPGAAGVVDELTDALGGIDVLSTAPAPAAPPRCSNSSSTPGDRCSRPTSTARSCVCSAPPAG